MIKKPVYLDYFASTPIDPRVIQKMYACLVSDTMMGNSTAKHFYGETAAKAIEIARAQVASLIHANPEEILFTSGATESINLAIKGIADFYQRRGMHIITTSIEHKAVLETCHFLQRKGFEVSYLAVDADGLINLDELKKIIRKETLLISVVHVNSEIGAIQPIAEIGKIAREHGIFFHVDAVQSAGKTAIDVKTMCVDLLSLSGHKCYGPKGVGALYVRQEPKIHLTPLLHGGGHERNLRSGTLATHQIIGMGEAYEIIQQEWQSDFARIARFKKKLITELKQNPHFFVNGNIENQVPHVLNFYFDETPNEKLRLILQEDIAVSAGASCNATRGNPSHVLMALGQSATTANCAIRLSMGRFTTEEEIDWVIDRLKDAYSLEK